MMSRPIPPRRPVEISATTTPMTEPVAASLKRGHHLRHRVGEPQPPERRPPRRGVGAHQLDRCRRRGGEPAEAADGDGEEGEERPEHGRRHPARPDPPAELHLAAPRRDERGEGDQRHRLGHHEVRHEAALDELEAGHHHGERDAEGGADREPDERPGATRTTTAASTTRQLARSLPRRSGSPKRASMSHTWGIDESRVRGRTWAPSDRAAVGGPDQLVQLPRHGDDQQGEGEHPDLADHPAHLRPPAPGARRVGRLTAWRAGSR